MNNLPALALTDRGDVLDTDTGAIIPSDDPAAVPATMTAALNTYARARVKAEALSLRLADMREPWIKAMDTGLAADPVYQALQAERAEALLVVDQTHAALSEYFQERQEKVSLDTGAVLVTWPKPRETWSLAQPPGWYAGDAARAQLRREIGNELLRLGLANEGNQIFAAEAAVMERVLAWLNPTAKVGALPEVRITLRGGS